MVYYNISYSYNYKRKDLCDFDIIFSINEILTVGKHAFFYYLSASSLLETESYVNLALNSRGRELISLKLFMQEIKKSI